MENVSVSNYDTLLMKVLNYEWNVLLNHHKRVNHNTAIQLYLQLKQSFYESTRTH